MTPSTACAKSACGTRTATSSPSEIRRKVVPLAGELCARAADGHRHLPFHRHRGLDAAAQGAARRLPSAPSRTTSASSARRSPSTTAGGQTLVSATTRELRDNPPPDMSLRDLGEHQLKDMDEPERELAVAPAMGTLLDQLSVR